MSEAPNTVAGMTNTFTDIRFHAPAIEFQKGVAVIDLPTLNLAAEKVFDELDKPVLLPAICADPLPRTLSNLAEVTVERNFDEITVTATIDTKKMVWALEQFAVRKSSFRDYAGHDRYGVSLSECKLAIIDGIAVSSAPMRLPNGTEILVWFAEVPVQRLETTNLYSLAALARSLTNGFVHAKPRQLDYVVIPAQQFKYERQMLEIMAINPTLIDNAVQRAFMGLDETGARVRVVTEFSCTGAPPMDPPPPTFHVFGEQAPVMFWFTETNPKEDELPFAVIATTSEAWLKPDQSVSFDDDAFSMAADPDTCPRCESKDSRPIYYGMIIPDEAYWRGEYVMGGCEIAPSNPTRECKTCGTRFGRTDDTN